MARHTKQFYQQQARRRRHEEERDERDARAQEAREAEALQWYNQAISDAFQKISDPEQRKRRDEELADDFARRMHGMGSRRVPEEESRVLFMEKAERDIAHLQQTISASRSKTKEHQQKRKLDRRFGGPSRDRSAPGSLEDRPVTIKTEPIDDQSPQPAAASSQRLQAQKPLPAFEPSPSREPSPLRAPPARSSFFADCFPGKPPSFGLSSSDATTISIDPAHSSLDQMFQADSEAKAPPYLTRKEENWLHDARQRVRTLKRKIRNHEEDTELFRARDKVKALNLKRRKGARAYKEAEARRKSFHDAKQEDQGVL
ncbi:hypothetical protein K490DRAFT_63804 [Saccharata proteae CBS 121410]|uniref:Uncharacterized protein n=1 Tax=Saccharata proteae CBS 121410 TaxID=1314787 RepID=A0A6A5YFU9_9PEZI|nr:hypothetical protein K490DRAFT_63804 [Saccharata proteae CBS 121410]